MNVRNFKLLAVATVLPWIAAGCGDSNSTTGPGPNAGSSVSLSLSTGTSAPTAAVISPAVFDLTLGNIGAASLSITRVAAVVREVELKRASDEDCDLIPDSADQCEEFETGPLLFELPLDGTVVTSRTITGVPADTYDELEFDIHKPSSTEDAAFLTANPDFDGVSIRVEYKFVEAGVPDVTGVFTTDLNEEQEVQLIPPLVITDTTTVANVTLTLDVDGWFRDAAGNLFDPALGLKGGVNENLVKDNIRGAIEIFKDDDHDGKSDD